MLKRSTAACLQTRMDPHDYEEQNENALDIRRIACAMFERAWLDLGTNLDVKPDDRRSAIRWFKGINQEGVLFSFELFCSILPMTIPRLRLLRKRIKNAERLNSHVPEDAFV